MNIQMNMTPTNTEIKVSMSKHDVKVFITNTPFVTVPLTVKFPTD